MRLLVIERSKSDMRVAVMNNNEIITLISTHRGIWEPGNILVIKHMCKHGYKALLPSINLRTRLVTVLCECLVVNKIS